MAAKKRKNSKRLNETQKVFLVQQLAQFYTPQEAAIALKNEHGVEVSPQGCEHYDPGKYAGRRLSAHLRDVFDSTRKQFLEKIEAIPHANRAVRIRKLARAADAFEQRNNLVAMADMLERIAKEVGNVHTNRRELTGRDGKPIETKDVTDYGLMTDDQLRRELTTLMVGRFGHLIASQEVEQPAPEPPDGSTRH